jgi:glycosyltransferase involved in cell wall biosynthesis
MNHKKIVILSCYAKSIVSFRGHLIRSLVHKGFSVIVLAPDLTSDIVAQINDLGASSAEINISRVNKSLFHEFTVFLQIYILFVRLSPHVVLTYFLKPNIFGIFAACLAFVPRRVCMVEGLGHYFTPSSSGQITFKKRIISEVILFLYRIIFSVSHTVITLNSDDTYLLTNRCGLLQPKSLQLHGIGISLDEWPLQRPFTSPLTFTFAGRLLFDKGIVEFLDAASIVKSIHANVRFVLLGDFDDNPSSIDYAHLEPLIEAGIIDWFGFTPPLPYYRQTSVFVLPSYREGCPRTIQEAMSCGLPIITTDVPGCRETVINGVNGYLVKPYSSASLVTAMQYFIHNPTLVSSMGLESRSLASSWFDVEDINAQIMSRLLR